MGPTGRKGVKTGIFFRVFLMKNWLLKPSIALYFY
jgi:hypothetical protein